MSSLCSRSHAHLSLSMRKFLSRNIILVDETICQSWIFLKQTRLFPRSWFLKGRERKCNMGVSEKREDYENMYGGVLQRCVHWRAIGYLEIVWIVLETIVHGQWAWVRTIKLLLTVWMIIVPNLCWQTFRYWAVRATTMWETWLSSLASQNNSDTVHSKQASNQIQDTVHKCNPQAKKINV
jgi:hypothetical protein